MIAYRDLLTKYDTTGLLGEAVYAMLRDCILDGSLRPGSQVRIDSLARQIGISRTPVREAIRRLEAEDYIQATARTGLVVKGLSEQELIEVFQIREALESQAAWLATRNLSPADLDALEAILKRMAKIVEHDIAEFRDLTAQFYRIIARAARNERLNQMIVELQARVRHFGASTLFIPGKAKERLDELKRLLETFKAGDADAAAEIVRSHRRRILDLRLRNYTGDDASHIKNWSGNE